MSERSEDIRAIKSMGKSVFIVKRQPGGSWKIARLIDNSDGAPVDPGVP